jgi:MYXO-CTERM domain-containing protein
MLGILGAAGVAHAQSSPLPASGTCIGGNGYEFAAQVGLAISDGHGSFATLQPAIVPYVFGAAECQCGTNDVNLEIKVTTPLPAGFSGNVAAYVGQTCENPAVRGTGTPAPCEQLTEGVPSAGAFVQGQGSDPIHIPLPSQALFSPNDHTCTQEVHSNGVYVLVGADPNAPAAVCYLSLTEQNHLPDVPIGEHVTRDSDGTVELSWPLPSPSATNPQGYQVLCGETDGKPASGIPAAVPGFSSCDAGVMHRRLLATNGPFDLPPPPQGSACSGMLAATTSHTQLTGLDPTKSYGLMLVSVDLYGNASLGATMEVGPAPAKPPAQGCSMAAGAPASSPLALPLVAALAGLAWRRRQRRA